MNSKLFNFLFLTFIFFGQQVMSHDHIEKFGTAKEAKELLERTINLVKSNETVAFAMITAGQGGLRSKDLYPFCTTMNGIMIAHPFISGTDMSNFKSSDGVKVADVMLKNAKEDKISKITYKLNRTGNTQDKEFKKTTFYTKVKSYVCASGYYSE